MLSRCSEVDQRGRKRLVWAVAFAWVIRIVAHCQLTDRVSKRPLVEVKESTRSGIGIVSVRTNATWDFSVLGLKTSKCGRRDNPNENWGGSMSAWFGLLGTNLTFEPLLGLSPNLLYHERERERKNKDVRCPPECS